MARICAFAPLRRSHRVCGLILSDFDIPSVFETRRGQKKDIMNSFVQHSLPFLLPSSVEAVVSFCLPLIVQQQISSVFLYI